MSYLARAHSVFGFNQVCEDLSVDGKRLLKDAGLIPFITADSNELISIDKMIDVIFKASIIGKCPHIGLKIVGQQDFRFLGVLGTIISCAPNVRRAWEVGERYLSTYSQGFTTKVIVDGRNSRSMYFWDIKQNEMFRPIVDLALAQNFMATNHITHGKWKPNAVCFSYTRPDNITPYRQFFQTKLIFDADFDGFFFDQSDLNMTLPGSNPQVFKALMHYGSLLLEGSLSSDLVINAKNMLKQMLIIGEKCSIGLLAQRLDLNVRSLQRRFKCQKASYQSILQEARVNLACFQLQHSEQSLTQIALLLGYQDLSSFSFAFKKTTGFTASEYRKSQASKIAS